MQDANRHNEIKGSRGERQVLGIRLNGEHLVGQILARDVNRATEVDCHHAGAESRGLGAMPSRTRTDIQHQLSREGGGSVWP